MLASSHPVRTAVTWSAVVVAGAMAVTATAPAPGSPSPRRRTTSSGTTATAPSTRASLGDGYLGEDRFQPCSPEPGPR